MGMVAPGPSNTLSPGRGRREPPSPRALQPSGRPASPTSVFQPPVRVLLVESDQAFAARLAGVLGQDGGFHVEQVSRISRALVRLARTKFDVVLSSLVLPDSAGPGTVRILRRAAPELALIVVSAAADLPSALDAVRDGADEYLVRDTLSGEHVVWLVRLVLARHRRPPEDGVAGGEFRAAGRHLLPLADRGSVHIGVFFVGLQPASRGTWADLDRLMVAAASALQRALRRCDLVSRLGPGELAVILVSDTGRPSGAVDRLPEVIAATAAGAHVRVGFAGYDAGDPATLDQLVDRAREDARRVAR